MTQAASEKICGTVYVLQDNVDTDMILTAEYLKINPSTPEGYAELASLAMCGLPENSLPFIDENTGLSKYDIIVGGKTSVVAPRVNTPWWHWVRLASRRWSHNLMREFSLETASQLDRYCRFQPQVAFVKR